MNMTYQRFRSTHETKVNLEKFVKALRDKSIEKETVDYREFGAAHYNVGDQRFSTDPNYLMRSTYNAQSDPDKLIGCKPAESLSKNGRSINVKLGFDKGKSKQLEEAE